ncbi:MAG: DUF6090 family protein [Robiginitalea sp.]
MVRFFNQIRQRLFTENPSDKSWSTGKFSKYLLYAIGEIMLVVIGILIALQIDNWNAGVRERADEKEMLMNLLDDLRAAREQSSQYIVMEEKLTADLIRALDIQPDGTKTPESFFSDNSIMSILWDFESNIPIIKSYAEIKNTGKTSLISNRDLREKFTNLETSLDKLQTLVKDRLYVQQLRIDAIAEDQINFVRFFNSSSSFLTVDLKNEKENDYRELLRDPRIRNLFAIKLALTEDVLTYRRELQAEIDLIIHMIDSELEKF